MPTVTLNVETFLKYARLRKAVGRLLPLIERGLLPSPEATAVIETFRDVANCGDSVRAEISVEDERPSRPSDLTMLHTAVGHLTATVAVLAQATYDRSVASKQEVTRRLQNVQSILEGHQP